MRRLRVDGTDLEGIHYLRAFGNSDAIRADAEQAERAVMIGGSYIGCEVAASLTAAHGVKCAIVMLEDVTLERQFGPEVGRFFQNVLEEHGIEVHGGDELDRFEGSDGRVRKVVTKGGLELDCDMVVIGVGVMPDVTLARSGRARAGRVRRGEVLVGAGDLGARRVRRRRHLRVREPGPRAARCAWSTGTWPSTTARPRP